WTIRLRSTSRIWMYAGMPAMANSPLAQPLVYTSSKNILPGDRGVKAPRNRAARPPAPFPLGGPRPMTAPLDARKAFSEGTSTGPRESLSPFQPFFQPLRRLGKRLDTARPFL